MIQIKKIHDLIDLILDKEHTAIEDRSRIDTAINGASLELFRALMKEYEKTLTISELLSPFVVSKPGEGLTGGKWTKTKKTWSEANSRYEGHEYFRHIRIATTQGKPIRIFDNNQFDYKKADPVDPPTVTDPICRIIADKLEFYPTNLTNIDIDYFKAPVEALFAYTVVNGVVTFSHANSVELEWPEAALPQLLPMVLSPLGIKLRAEDVLQYSELQKAQNR